MGIDAKLGYRVGFKYVTIMCICLSVLQVDELRTSHPIELFYF